VASNDKASSADSRAVDDRVPSAQVVVRRLPMGIPSGAADRRSSRAEASTRQAPGTLKMVGAHTEGESVGSIGN